MGQLVPSAVLDQQMPADQIGQTGTVFQAIVPGHGAAWGKFGACEEITELLEGCAVLKGHAHQAGYYIVKRDGLESAVTSFHPKEDLGRGGIVVNGDVQRPLVCNADLLSDVVTTGGESKARAHDSSPSV